LAKITSQTHYHVTYLQQLHCTMAQNYHTNTSYQ